MSLNFVGDVDSIREPQKQFILEVLENRGYENCDVKIEPVGKAGDNYIANVKRIVVEQDGETFKMIAKLAHDNPVIREMTNVTALFSNETVIYTELFPRFKELQINAGIPEDELFQHAECYGAFTEVPNEVILLEDLKEAQYEITNRFEPTTDENVRLVMKSFAVYHSLSFVLKHQDPEAFANMAGRLIDPLIAAPDKLEMKKALGKQMEETMLAGIVDERSKTALTGALGNLLDISMDFAKEVSGTKYSTIVQGDGWVNNILFKLEEDQPAKCILIDYQMAKESVPVYDVMYMLFNSTDPKTLVDNFNTYLDVYHEEMVETLKKFDLEAEDIYPRGQVDIDAKSCAKIVLAISVIVTNLIIKDVAEASKLQEDVHNASDVSGLHAIMQQTPASENLFRKKMEGIANCFLDLGLL